MTHGTLFGMKKMKVYGGAVLVILFVVASFYSYFILGNQARSTRALEKGREYASKMYNDYRVAGENCQGEDTDNNGYVTCNFRLKGTTNGTERTITLQCPTFIKSFMATSCKEQGIVINGQ